MTGMRARESQGETEADLDLGPEAGRDLDPKASLGPGEDLDLTQGILKKNQKVSQGAEGSLGVGQRVGTGEVAPSQVQDQDHATKRLFGKIGNLKNI